MSNKYKNLFDLTGKVAIVTGSSRGIGASIAEAFAEFGASVVLSSRTKESVDEIATNIKKNGFKAEAVECHVGEEEQLKNLVETTIKTYGKIDILVNNAGINGFENRQNLLDERIKVNNHQSKEFSETGKIKSHFDVTVNLNDEDWHKMIGIHLNGTFFCTREALKIMNNQESGSIINMGSVLGTTGGPSSPHYSAAKAGILGFTRATARELASRNIRVNAIAPGYIDTEMTTHLGDVKKIVMSATPMKRFGDVADIAWAAVYLGSDESKFVTGQTISPNGGFVMSQ